MTLHFPDFDPNRLAAILYRPADDVDALLADFAANLLKNGERIGGIVQRNLKDQEGRQVSMRAIDLVTGRQIGISQALGSGSQACKLNTAGLAEACVAVSSAIASEVDLVIVNKFSQQEAAGGGLRNEMAEAILAGLPLLTAVSEKCIGAWKEFTGDRGTTLLCARHVVESWWDEVSHRDALARSLPPSADTASPDRVRITFRS